MTVIGPPTRTGGAEGYPGMQILFEEMFNALLSAGQLDLRGSYSMRDGDYKWTVSPNNSNEYFAEAFAGGRPPNEFYDPGSPTQPPSQRFEFNGVAAIRGDIGSLEVGEFAVGDIDANGFISLYVRMPGNVDPDTLAVDYIQAIGALYEFEPTGAFDGTGCAKFTPPGRGNYVGLSAAEAGNFSTDARHIFISSMLYIKRELAEFSRAGTGGAYTFSPTNNTITRTSGDFDVNLVPGMYIEINGTGLNDMFTIITARPSASTMEVLDLLTVETDGNCIVWQVSGVMGKYCLTQRDSGATNERGSMEMKNAEEFDSADGHTHLPICANTDCNQIGGFTTSQDDLHFGNVNDYSDEWVWVVMELDLDGVSGQEYRIYAATADGYFDGETIEATNDATADGGGLTGFWESTDVIGYYMDDNGITHATEAEWANLHFKMSHYQITDQLPSVPAGFFD